MTGTVGANPFAGLACRDCGLPPPSDDLHELVRRLGWFVIVGRFNLCPDCLAKAPNQALLDQVKAATRHA
jgi:hypothetical protein